MRPHRLCLLHPYDPRLEATDPTEGRLRRIAATRPGDFELLVVGIDRCGDLTLGVPVAIEVGGRHIDFLPVARSGGIAFAAGLLRHAVAVRAAARAEVSSVSVHDFAWASLAPIAGRPIVLVVHRDPRADAVAGRASVLARLREASALRLVDRIVGCDPAFVRRIRETNAAAAAKTELLQIGGTQEGAGFFPEETRVARLWERHRRLFDVHAVHRAGQVPA